MRPSLLVATMTLMAGVLAVAQAQNDGDAAPSPFVAPSDALSDSPVFNPFAAPAATTDNPFVVPGNAPDPFAAAPTVTIPFTAPSIPATGAAPTDDPFGTTSPFVRLSEGAGAPVPAPAAGGVNDPFATTTTTDPFSGPTPSTDPFANTASTDPFSTTTATATTSTTPGASANATNPDGIAEAGLTDFRYDRVQLWDGREVVARRPFTRAEALSFDQTRKDEIRADMLAGRLPGYTPQAGGLGLATATAPDAWVAWAYYYEQLDMWAEYTEHVGLGGKSAEGPLMDDITWPGVATADAAGGAGVAGGGFGVGGVGLGNEGSSLGGFPGGGAIGGFPGGGLISPLGAGPGGQGNQSVTEKVVGQILGAYERAQDELASLEEDQNTFMQDLLTGIETRADRRNSYKEWREARQQAVEDYLNNDWRRRYDGEVAMVGGVRYELYRPGSEPTTVPRNVRVVISDTMRLTPFDLIDEKTGLVLNPPTE